MATFQNPTWSNSEVSGEIEKIGFPRICSSNKMKPGSYIFEHFTDLLNSGGEGL